MAELTIHPASSVGAELTMEIDAAWGSFGSVPPEASRQMPLFISHSQAYYWSRAWQAGEAEALAELAAGEGRIFRDPRALARYLLAPED